MRQRGWTVLVGAALVVLLSALVGLAPVPYVLLEPGPTFDTLGVDDQQHEIIVIDGTPTSDSAGELRFLTVGLVPRVTLLEAVRGWLSGDEAVQPREIYYPPDQTTEEVQEENHQAFTQSLSTAQSAALDHLGLLKVTIKEVADDSPNAGLLKPGDVITAVDGSEHPLLEPIRAKPAGSTLMLTVQRDGAPVTVEVTTKADAEGNPILGFMPELTSTADFTISIPIEGIGGPSAGLMLTLGILDKLDPQDLTGGKIIAGTGTMNEFGQVGPIGGIAQKIVGAKAAGATIFLTPADNCAEAVANARPGVLLVRIDTLGTALGALRTLRDGGTPTLCPGAPRP
jgi:Lon-like protease